MKKAFCLEQRSTNVSKDHAISVQALTVVMHVYRQRINM